MYSVSLALMLVLFHILFNVLPFVGGNEGENVNQNDDEVIRYDDFVKNGLRRVTKKFRLKIGPHHDSSAEVKDECLANVFYPADPVEIVDNVRAAEDCVVMCRSNELCVTSYYFYLSKKCFMSSAYLIGTGVRVMAGMDTQYCVVFHLTFAPKKEPPKKLLYGEDEPLGCGRRKLFPWDHTIPARRQKRIIAGEKAIPYSLPFVVRIENSDFKGVICGGALVAIDDSSTSTIFVVTAAHCFVDLDSDSDVDFEQKPERIPQNVKVYAGSHDMRFTQPHEKSLKVEAVFVHTQVYNTENGLANDVAVLMLKNVVEFNWYVNAACLQKPEGFMDKMSNIMKRRNQYQECYTAGWGACSATIIEDQRTRIHTDQCYPDSLRYARTKVTHEKNSGLILFTEPVTRGQPAEADSGGPLLCLNDEQRFFLRGVGHARDEYQNQYTRKWNERYNFNAISNDQVKWILKIMNRTLHNKDVIDGRDAWVYYL